MYQVSFRHINGKGYDLPNNPITTMSKGNNCVEIKSNLFVCQSTKTEINSKS